jgi:hypothetical protein
VASRVGLFLQGAASVLVATALACSTTATASASWAKGQCYEAEHHHCYAFTQWVMTYPGESVKGAEDIPETTSMDVPEWENGSFVTNEMWLSFWETGGGWLEVGQIGGQGSCCTLHPFIAHAEYVNAKDEPIGYQEYTWTEVNAEPRNLYRIEDPAANGTWCEYIWNNEVDCKSKPGHWTTYSDELQAGLEAYANAKPTNSGRQEVDYIAHGGEHRAWGSKEAVTGYITPGAAEAKELCLSPNSKSNYPGNAEWSTC